MNEMIFEVGDMMVWDPVFGEKHKDLYNSSKTLYGGGPFRAVEVVDVPPDSDSKKGVAHSQWVFTETLKGRQQFSGAWFKKV